MSKNNINQQGIIPVAIVFIIGLAMILLGGAGALAFNNRVQGIGGSLYSPEISGGGGGALFYPSGADPNKIGQCLDSWFSKKRPDSPLAGLGNTFATEGQKYNVNPALLIAIAGAESTYGTDFSGAINRSTHNYGSMTCDTAKLGDYPCVASNGSNQRTWESFPSFEEAIANHAEYMQRVYLSQGLTDIRSIGEKYCGPTCNHWFDVTPKVFNEITAYCPVLKINTVESIINGEYVSLAVPLIRQRTSGSCGRAATAMVANYYGASDQNNLNFPNPSYSLSLLKKLSGKNWQIGRVTAEQSSWEVVMTALKKGNPVILMQRLYWSSSCNVSRSSKGHVIVIKGYDPTTGELMINSSRTDKAVSCRIKLSKMANYDSLDHFNSSRSRGRIIYSNE